MPSATLVATLIFAAYFLAVYRPLARRVSEANAPLGKSWSRLVETNAGSVACAGLELGAFEPRLESIRIAATNLATSGRLIRDRIEPVLFLEQRLDEAFVLNDFEIEQGILVETLTQLAKKSKVGLAPAVLAGLPAYEVDEPRPSLLWARLHQSEQLLRVAMAAPVTAIGNLVQLPAVSHRSLDPTERSLEELPLRIEFTAPMEGLARLLASLPLRGEELPAVGLPASLTNKPVLFLDRLLLKKSAPNRPGEVTADLRLGGFVPFRGLDAATVEERAGP